MLRLSKKADYALISMTHLALNGDGSSSAREIAGLYDIPIELLAKILQEKQSVNPDPIHEAAITPARSSP